MHFHSASLTILLGVALFPIFGTANPAATKATSVKPTATKATSVKPTCTKDACLKVVKANYLTGHLGTTGCKAFFKTTVIPATVSTTVTTTTTTTITLLGPSPAYTTTTKSETSSTTVIETSTLVETTTVTPMKKRAAAPTVKHQPEEVRAVEDRKANGPRTTSQTTVAAYASSACQNTRAYSTACSCIGIKHSTITARTPTATETFTSRKRTTKLLGTSTTITITSTRTRTVSDTSTITVTSTATEIDDGSPTRVLTGATPVATYDLDDDAFVIDVPFPVGIYGTKSTTLGLACNGFAYLGDQAGRGNVNGNIPSYGYSDDSMPPTSFALYWKDLYAKNFEQFLSLEILRLTGLYRFYNVGNGRQGIFYKIQGSVGNRKLLVEWSGTDYNDRQAYDHFVLSLPESDSEQITYTYYQTTTVGSPGTVGAQSQEADSSTMVDFDIVDAFTPGTVLAFDPAQNKFVVQ